MHRATLTREEGSKEGTFGRFRVGVYHCFSVELPDRGNKPNISCIPVGVYKCVWTYSPRFKRHMYLLEGVPERSGVRIHSANLARQLNGCIALGLKLGTIEGTKAVLLSKPAVRQLEEYLQGKPFLLEIKYMDCEGKTPKCEHCTFCNPSLLTMGYTGLCTCD